MHELKRHQGQRYATGNGLRPLKFCARASAHITVYACVRYGARHITHDTTTRQDGSLRVVQAS